MPRLVRSLGPDNLMNGPSHDGRDLRDSFLAAGLKIIEFRRGEPVKSRRGEPEPLTFALARGRIQRDLFAAIVQAPGYAPAASPFPARSLV